MALDKLLGIGNDSKTIKGEKKGYMTAILYLAPHKLSGVMNVCPAASAGCISACLVNSGHGGMSDKNGYNRVQECRIEKTKFLHSNRKAFMAQLELEITKFVKRAEKKGLTPCIRFNGTSDLPFYDEKFTGGLVQKFPDLQFYDYSKIPKVAQKFATGQLPKNYHVTFSRSESNESEVLKVLELGGNVAVVFDSKNLPETWKGYKVINGDESDLRFLDEPNSVCGLYVKGHKAKRESAENSFIVKVGDAL